MKRSAGSLAAVGLLFAAMAVTGPAWAQGAPAAGVQNDRNGYDVSAQRRGGGGGMRVGGGGFRGAGVGGFRGGAIRRGGPAAGRFVGRPGVAWRGGRWWGPRWGWRRPGWGWGWPVAAGFAFGAAASSSCGWVWTPSGFRVWRCWPYPYYGYYGW
jgi:hypothetical protein